jgi:hypothetical protein
MLEYGKRDNYYQNSDSYTKVYMPVNRDHKGVSLHDIINLKK